MNIADGEDFLVLVFIVGLPTIQGLAIEQRDETIGSLLLSVHPGGEASRKRIFM